MGALSTPGFALTLALVAGLTLSALACDAGSDDASDIPERESAFATAEAERKSAAGDCRIGPGAQCEGADFEGADLAAEQLGNNLQEDGVDLSEANLRFAT